MKYTVEVLESSNRLINMVQDFDGVRMELREEFWNWAGAHMHDHEWSCETITTSSTEEVGFNQRTWQSITHNDTSVIFEFDDPKTAMLFKLTWL